MPRMDASLDLFDRKILALVQRDCQMNAEVIAQEVGLSASAVQRRLPSRRIFPPCPRRSQVLPARRMATARLPYSKPCSAPRSNKDP